MFSDYHEDCQSFLSFGFRVGSEAPCQTPVGGNSDALTCALRHQTLMPSRILSGQDLRTTLMIRNIPVRLTSETLKEVMKLVIEINDYDMLKLPQDKHRKGCNLGYAFINLTSSDGVLRFWQAMHGRQWATLCPKSSKCCSIAYAAMQVGSKS